MVAHRNSPPRDRAAKCEKFLTSAHREDVAGPAPRSHAPARPRGPKLPARRSFTNLHFVAFCAPIPHDETPRPWSVRPHVTSRGRRFLPLPRGGLARARRYRADRAGRPVGPARTALHAVAACLRTV